MNPHFPIEEKCDPTGAIEARFWGVLQSTHRGNLRDLRQTEKPELKKRDLI